MQKTEFKEKKIGFFKKVKLSVIDFDKYFIIATEKPIRTLLYLFKLFIIFSIIITVTLTYKISTIVNEVSNYIEKDTPNFYLQEGKFTIEKEDALIIENNEYTNIKIIMTNETNTGNYNEDIEKYDGFLIIFLQNEMIIKDNANSIRVFDYSQLQEQYGLSDMTKQGILELLGSRTVYITIFFYLLVVTFMIYFGSMLIDIIALTILGYIITRIASIPLKFSAIFAMAASSITLPVILNIIYVILNTFTGYTIPEFQIMYTIISYIYLIASIIILRSNLIKNKNIVAQEIAKIGEENTDRVENNNSDNQEDRTENKNEKDENEEENEDKKEKEREKENKNLNEQGLGEN